MRNQKGVTLIALVVTIIVLIILAGVSIAILTGDNGIIDRAKEAQKEQIKGEVRDMITMAIASAKLKAEQESVTNPSGFLASDDLQGHQDYVDPSDGTTKTRAKSASLILAELRTVLPSADYHIKITDGAKGSDATVTITYINVNYASAVNVENTKIQVPVTVSGNAFSVGTYNYNLVSTVANLDV